jgi:FAD:protein FMN transferase
MFPTDLLSVKRCRPLLGTYVEIKVWHSCSKKAHEAINAAFNNINYLQDILSIHKPNSCLSIINKALIGDLHEIDDNIYELLNISQSLHKLSNGLFNVVFSRKEHKHADFDSFELIDKKYIKLYQEIRFDFGGIGKGFIVDKAVETLLNQNIIKGVINAGGDLRVFGDIKEKIHIRNPLNYSEFIFASEIENCAIATSANYFRKNDLGCTNDLGILDPSTGDYWEQYSSVSVLAPTCTIADALTKIVALKESIASDILREKQAYALLYDGTKTFLL